MNRIYVYLAFVLLIFSCGGTSNEDEKLKLEKEKLELEKKKLELEREKLGSGDNQDSNVNSDNEPKEKKKKSIKQPSIRSQESVIYDFYRDFDNAFDQGSMRDFIDNYYSSSIKAKYLKEELPSYNYYSFKEHAIDEITLMSETDDSRKYKVVFYFNFNGNNGSSGSNKCADIMTLDNNNLIIARSQLGKVK